MLKSLRTAFALCLTAAFPLFAGPDTREHDDCQAGFIAFIGSDAYQLSPRHGGELGSVRLFTLLSYQEAAVRRDAGRILWRLTIRPAEARRAVYSAHGETALDLASGVTLVEHFWNGQDRDGSEVPPGMYAWTFEARFLPDRLKRGEGFRRYEDLAGVEGVVEAYPSTDHLLVDPTLGVEQAHLLRASAKATTCEVQQNAPMESGYRYSFYYGSTHAHSNYSDGGQPTSDCASSNAYGSGDYTPGDVYAYARSTAGLDFWVINEHNHLINDSVSNNDPPLSEAKVRQRYQDGRAAAQAASVDGSFVALYGMEWGVTTNSDQGHVTLLETPTLFGWETCSGCNGPSAECTPGTNCYFDVFTPKRYGYLTLYRRSVENPSPAGALGILAHPGSSHFDNFAFDANADAALQGIAVRSGLAFSAATNCADANVGATDYSSRWRQALNLGFHLGPVADHDSHCNNYGQALPTRTVYLLPNDTSPVLTRGAVMEAHKARHFFATEDPNAQLVFGTSDGAHVMGDIFTASGGATLRVALYDPNGDGTSSLEIWRGQIGAGVPSAAYASYAGQSLATLTETMSSGTYYYFVHAVQADGHDVWSAPMWITYVPGDPTPPSTAITSPANGATVSGTIVVTASASDNLGVASVQFYLDGVLRSTDTGSPYQWSWDTTAASNGGHTLETRAYDAAGNVGFSPSVGVTVSNVSGTDVSSWRIVQANSSITYTLPSGTLIPADGYLIVGRNATKAAFEAYWRGGTPLPGNVVYINSAGSFPQINGSENYTLYNAGGTKVDGKTVSMSSSAGQSLRRKDPCNAPGSASSWNIGATSAATPGSGAGAGCAKGVVINEFSDATGTGNYVYEFVELHNDR